MFRNDESNRCPAGTVAGSYRDGESGTHRQRVPDDSALRRGNHRRMATRFDRQLKLKGGDPQRSLQHTPAR